MSKVPPSPPIVHSVSEVEQYAGWILGMAVAVAVLFQVHLSLPGGVINLNLADPFAVLTLTAAGLHLWFARQSPRWKIRGFNLALIMMSTTLLLAFLHGWAEIGITQWALAGRLFGWFVLLGYLAAGYVIVTNVGHHGLRRFAETLICVAVVIVAMQVILRLLEQWGLHTGARLTQNFEGYAGNRNAFAFQLLVVVALLLGYFEVYARSGAGGQSFSQRSAAVCLLGILLAGLVWTGSRVGILVGAAMLLVGVWVIPATRRPLGVSVIVAAALWTGVLLAAQKSLIMASFSGDGYETQINYLPMQVFSPEAGEEERLFFSSPSSNQERWDTIVHGFDLWLQSPFVGAGLGVFNAKSSAWFGYPQVIHSTPIWMLAECGLFGAAVFAWGLFLPARYAIRFDNSRPSHRILLLLLPAFAIFGLAHEIFFQRIFWLVLGAALAQPYTSRGSR